MDKPGRAKFDRAALALANRESTPENASSATKRTPLMKPKLASTQFRVFVSSTFEDFKYERAALQPVFRRLAAHCEARGAKFQAIDLRFGISDEAVRDQRTLDLCLREIERCKQVSTRPNFLCLLGDRYGWRPLPSRLSATALDLLAPMETDRAELERWYLKDEHAAEPVWTLTRGVADEEEWKTASVAIRRLITVGLARSPEARRVLPGAERSATHHEIEAGIFSDTNTSEHALVYERRISNSDATAESGCYREVEEAGQFLVAAPDMLQALKERLAMTAGVRYRGFDCDLSGDAPSSEYLSAFANDVEASLLGVVNEELGRFEQLPGVLLEREIHRAFAEQRADLFLGREPEVHQVERYLVEDTERSRVFRVTGPGGIGKSALMARLANDWSMHADVALVARFVGASVESSRPETLFSGVTQELELYVEPMGESRALLEPLTPEGFVGSVAIAAEKRRVILLLDGIDQLELSHARDIMNWLPAELPPNVRVVVAGRASQVMEVLAFNGAPSEQLELSAFTSREASDCLDAMLGSFGRRASGQHRVAALERLAHGATPLEVRLIATRLAARRSFDACPDLGSDLPSTIDALLDELMTPVAHSRLLVARALTLLVVGRAGIADEDMPFLLALDANVANEFRATAHHAWDLNDGVPRILWSRLFDDLAPYLMLRDADGHPQLAFFHREFADRVRTRLLLDPEAQRGTHALLADYFDRPIAADTFRAVAAGNPRITRQVSVIADHSWHAGRADRFGALLADFAFLMARCAGRHPASFLADVMLPETPPEAMREALGFLRQSVGLLFGGGASWPAYKVLLQLAMEQPKSHVIRRSAAAWLETGACDWTWLADARATCGRQELHTVRLAGHAGGVHGISHLDDGTRVSWGGDGALRISDVETGVELDAFLDHTGPVIGVLVDADEVISWSRTLLVRRSRATGQRLSLLDFEGEEWFEVKRLPDAGLVVLYEDGSIQLLRFGAERIEPRLSCPHGVRGASRSFLPGVSPVTAERVVVWAEWQVTVWDVAGGELLDGWSIVDRGLDGTARIRFAGCTDEGELYAADDDGRLYCRRADGALLEVRFGGPSMHYWERPYRGGVTLLADGSLLLWQAFFDSTNNETGVRRFWAIWNPKRGVFTDEGQTQSEPLSTGPSAQRDIATASQTHDYPLLEFSGKRFIGCHGSILTLVDLDAGVERVVYRVSKELEAPAALVLDASTICFTDHNRTWLARLDAGIALARIDRGLGRVTAGAAVTSGRYSIGFDGGSLLHIEIAPGDFLPTTLPSVAERNYHQLVMLPQQRFAALERTWAARGEIDIFELRSPERFETLLAHRFDPEQAHPHSKAAYELGKKAEALGATGTASTFDWAYGVQLVSGLLFTFGYDGLKIWDDRAPSPLLGIDLSSGFGCWKMLPFWLDREGAYETALAATDSRGRELAVIALTTSGDTLLWRPMSGRSSVLARGNLAMPSLAHTYQKGLEIFENRWLVSWCHAGTPNLWDLEELFRGSSSDPATSFETLATTPFVNERVREAVGVRFGRSREIAHEAFSAVTTVQRLPRRRFGFTRAAGDIVILDHDGSNSIVLRGDRLAVLDDGTIAAWMCGNPARGADRRYRVHTLEGGLLATSPRHDSDILGVAPLDNGELLSWTLGDYFYCWSPGDVAFRKRVHLSEVIAAHGAWLDVRAGKGSNALVLGPRRWFGWTAANAIGLTEARVGGDCRTLFWQGTEAASIHALDSSGTILATTVSGRLLVLELYRGRERVSFSSLAAEPDSPQLREAEAQRDAAQLRSKALFLCQLNRREQAAALLDVADALFEQLACSVDSSERLNRPLARLRLAWSAGDRAKVLETSEQILRTDLEGSTSASSRAANDLRFMAVAAAAAMYVLNGKTQLAEELLFTVVSKLDPSVESKSSPRLKHTLLYLIENFVDWGWLTSPDAVLLAKQVALAVKRALVVAQPDADPAGAIIDRALEEVVEAASRAGQLELVGDHLYELDTRVRAGVRENDPLTRQLQNMRRIADISARLASALADLGDPEAASSVFSRALSHRQILLRDAGRTTEDVVAVYRLLGAWGRLEAASNSIAKACCMAVLIAQELREERAHAAPNASDQALELIEARAALLPLIELQPSATDQVAEVWEVALDAAAFASAEVARARAYGLEDVDTFLGTVDSVAKWKARDDRTQDPVWREHKLYILLEALDSNPEGQFAIALSGATIDIVRRYVELSLISSALEIAGSTFQKLKQRAAQGVPNAARAASSLMSETTTALLDAGHLPEARSAADNHTFFLRELLDAGQALELLGDWGPTAAKCIALIERDLGFERAGGYALSSLDVALRDQKKYASDDSADLGGGKWRLRDAAMDNWLSLLLATDALCVGREVHAPPEIVAGFCAIARSSARFISDAWARDRNEARYPNLRISFEKSVLAWLGLALRENESPLIESALELLDRTCASVLPVARWQKIPALEGVISRLLVSAATVDADSRRAILQRWPSQASALVQLLGWTADSPA